MNRSSVDVVFMLNRSPRWMPIPGTWIWTLMAFLQLVLLCVGWNSTGADSLLKVLGLLVLGQLAVPWAVEAGRQSLLRWVHQAPRFFETDEATWKTWCRRELSAFAGGWFLMVAGATIMLVGLLVYHQAGLFASIPSKAWRAAAFWMLAQSSFFAGVGIGNVLLVARMVWRSGKFNVRVTADPYGVVSTGFMVGKVCFAAAVVWLFYVGSVSSGKINPWIPLWACGIPAALLFLVSFLVSQIPLHLRMVEYKHASLCKLDSLNPDLANAQDTETASQMIEQMRKLDEARLQLSKLPDWPFQWGAMATTMASSVMSITPTIVNIIPTATIKSLAE